MENKENQESNGKRERRIIPIIKRSKEQSRTVDDQKRQSERKGEAGGKGRIGLELSVEAV